MQETACRQILAWHEQRPDQRPLDVSVNLSARQVAHRDLAASVAEILARTGLDPVHLRLEITESVLVEESASAQATLEALSELGVRLVLDDFGTGYSSLAYLNRFPLDALKIDRAFVDALGVEQERTAIVEAIIGMARALSLDVIAEGVENEAQLSELRRLGCDYAQGHLFSRALPPEKITGLLSRGLCPLLGDLAGQVVVAEHLRGRRRGGDQRVVPHPGDEVGPLRRRSSRPSVAEQRQGRLDLGPGQLRVEVGVGFEQRVDRRAGALDGGRGAAGEGGEEEPDASGSSSRRSRLATRTSSS